MVQTIYNVSQKTLVSEQVCEYCSAWKKGIGLMFRLSSPTFTVLFSFSQQKRVGIHMFFVFFPLDIIWLDVNKVIVAAKTLTPWTLHTPKERVKYVLECPKGTLNRSKSLVGDRLQW